MVLQWVVLLLGVCAADAFDPASIGPGEKGWGYIQVIDTLVHTIPSSIGPCCTHLYHAIDTALASAIVSLAVLGNVVEDANHGYKWTFCRSVST